MLPSVDAAKPVPGISVTTSTNRSSPLIVGDIVTFIFTVTNTGKDRLTDISVVNDVVGPAVFQSGDKRNNGILESSEAWIFTSTYIVTATPNPLVNTVTVTANYRGGSVSNSEVYSIEVLGEDGLLPDILTSPNQELSGGWYGCSVATGEGLIVVGAAYESIPLYSVTVTAKKPSPSPSKIYAAGRAYVYSAADGTLLNTIVSPTPAEHGWFGYSVAVGDGLIIVGAPMETSGTVTSSGNIHVYDATTRNHIATLTSPNPVSNGDGYGYGYAVAVNNGIIAVGAPWETVDAIGAGRVYLYNSDTTPIDYSPLISPNLTPQEYGRFGASLAIDNGYLVVGAPYEDTQISTDTIEGCGKVYIYNTANGDLINTIISLNPEFAGHFGFSAAIDSNLLVIGAFDESVDSISEAGQAYVYNLATNTFEHTLNSENPQQHGLFGYSVAIDNGLIVVGAVTETSNSIANVGNAYVFDALTGTTEKTLTTPIPQEWADFGWSAAINSNLIIIGAYDAVFISE